MFGNNGGGNPNHAADGKFTSGANQAGNGGNKVAPKDKYEDQIKEKLGIKNDANPSYEEKMQSAFGMKNPQPMEKPKKKWTIGTNGGQLLGDEEIIEADTEEEAFKIAEDRYPGYADELSVNPVEDNNVDMPENDKFSEARKQLDQYGEAIVGEEGDRVFSVSTDGEKFYGFSYRTNYDGPIEGTEEEYDNGYNSLEEAVAAMEKDGYPIYDEFKNSEAPKKTEEDLKKFEDTHKFEVIYDYDYDGNRNGYELKFENPEDQKAYEQLTKEVYSDSVFANDYDQKIQNQLGISEPESKKKEDHDLLKNGMSEKTYNILKKAGVTTIEDLINMDEKSNGGFWLGANTKPLTREAKFFVDFYKKNNRFPSKDEIDTDYIQNGSYDEQNFFENAKNSKFSAKKYENLSRYGLVPNNPTLGNNNSENVYDISKLEGDELSKTLEDLFNPSGNPIDEKQQKYLDAVKMYVVDNMNFKEIAAALGLTREKAAMRVSAGLHKIKNNLNK